jgi:hypothetical protein
MGTRSTIALEFADGTVEQVYCHWDGYLEHNGKILAEHYSDPFKLRDLIDQGDLSSLRSNIGVEHGFSVHETLHTVEEYDNLYGDMCVFYTRDRGEPLRVNKFKDLKDYYENCQHEEYDYILRQVEGKAVWFVSDHDGAYVELTQAIMDEQDQIAQEETA